MLTKKRYLPVCTTTKIKTPCKHYCVAELAERERTHHPENLHPLSYLTAADIYLSTVSLSLHSHTRRHPTNIIPHSHHLPKIETPNFISASPQPKKRPLKYPTMPSHRQLRLSGYHTVQSICSWASVTWSAAMGSRSNSMVARRRRPACSAARATSAYDICPHGFSLSTTACAIAQTPTSLHTPPPKRNYATCHNQNMLYNRNIYI